MNRIEAAGVNKSETSAQLNRRKNPAYLFTAANRAGTRPNDDEVRRGFIHTNVRHWAIADHQPDACIARLPADPQPAASVGP